MNDRLAGRHACAATSHVNNQRQHEARVCACANMNQSPAAAKAVAAAAAPADDDGATCQPCKRRKREPRYFPWCDGAFRCTICPNALGKDGRGYTRARNVPCTNPEEHLTLRTETSGDYWDMRDVLHWDTLPARNLDSGTQPRVNMVKAAGDGWCRQCDTRRIHTNGRYPHLGKHHVHPLLQAAGGCLDDHYQLSDRLLRMSAKWSRQRETKVQVPLCNGNYVCMECALVQPWPLTKAQCPHVDNLPKAAPGTFLHISRCDQLRQFKNFRERNFAKHGKAVAYRCGYCMDRPREQTADQDLEQPADMVGRFTESLTLGHVCVMTHKLACNVTKQDVERVVAVTGIPKFHWHDSLKHLMEPRESGAGGARSE